MKDIFNIPHYILEADDDNIDTDFSSATDANTDNNDDDVNTDDTVEDVDTDFTGGDGGIDDGETADGDSEDGIEGEPQEDNPDNPDTEEDAGIEGDYQEDEEVDIIAMEKELFADMSDFDRMTRNEELKESFNNLYTFILKLLGRISQVKSSNVNLKVLEFCEQKILDLKQLTYHHIVYNFTNTSYIQNQIRYKTILFTISKIIDMLNKISNDTTNDEE